MMAHFYLEPYYQGKTIQEVTSRHEEALLNVCFNSQGKLKRGVENVTKRQPHCFVTCHMCSQPDWAPCQAETSCPTCCKSALVH